MKHRIEILVAILSASVMLLLSPESNDARCIEQSFAYDIVLRLLQFDDS